MRKHWDADVGHRVTVKCATIAPQRSPSRLWMLVMAVMFVGVIMLAAWKVAAAGGMTDSQTMWEVVTMQGVDYWPAEEIRFSEQALFLVDGDEVVVIYANGFWLSIRPVNVYERVDSDQVDDLPRNHHRG